MKMIKRWRRFLCAGVLAGWAGLFLVSCATPEAVDDEPLPPAEPLPAMSYREAATRYNQHVSGLERLWSRSVVEVSWIEDDGDRRSEQGEGHFVFVPPRRVALSVGKLGKTILWAGSNDERYWLIDNQGDGIAYVGKHPTVEVVGPTGDTEMRGPLPFKPDDVPFLMGLRPLPLEEDHEEGATQAAAGRAVARADQRAYVVTPPRGRVRLHLEPERMLPIRVDLFDAAGNLAARSELSKHQRLDQVGTPVNTWPTLATEARLRPADPDRPDRVDPEQRLRLILSGLTADSRKIKDRAFDFDTLLRVYEPAEVTLLDPPTQRVAPLPATRP
ncbi:MAG: hypothetical protein ACOC3G_00785 [Phycisphaeraceae bacterium]